MPSRIPFVRPMRDDSQSTARISDLIRMRGAQQAGAIAEAGARSGQMWQDVGRNVSGVVSDLLRAKAYEDEQKPIREARAQEQSVQDAIRLTPRDEQTGRLDYEQIADEVARIDPEKALEWWRRSDDQAKATLVADHQRVEQVAKAAGTLLVDLEQTPEPERQPKWTTARTSAIEGGLLDGPDDMPEQVDMGWLKQTFNQARSVSDIARELQSIGEQEESYTLGPGQVRYAGGKEVARGPEKTAEPARAGTFEALVDGMADEKGAPLSTREVLTARRQWMDAGRRPPGEGPAGVSQAQRAAAERWKQNELRGAEKVFAETTKDLDREAFPEDEATWTQALGDLNESKRRIQVSFLEQIESTEMTLPEDAPRNAAAPPPGAPGGRRAASPTASPFGATEAEAAPAPGGEPAPAPPPPQPRAVPQAEAPAELRRARPGMFTLENGEVWMITPDKRAVRVR